MNLFKITQKDEDEIYVVADSYGDAERTFYNYNDVAIVKMEFVSEYVFIQDDEEEE